MRTADRLTPADRALWRRVAATVRPLRPAPAEAPPATPGPAAGPAMPPTATAPSPPPRPGPRARPAPPAADAATLDGGWDRRARTGRVEPDLVVDLHGYGVEQAHLHLERRLTDAHAGGARVALVITGKGSRGPEDRRGAIRARLPLWLTLPALRPLVAATRPAHPRHGGAGALYVVLRRRR